MTPVVGKGGLLQLSAADAAHAREVGVRAAMLGVDNRDSINYASPYVASQTAQRWEGIERGARSWRGDFPVWADCSAFATWVHWDATRKFAAPDYLNGLSWQYGFTGTQIKHGKVASLDHLRVLDLVFYGRDAKGEPTHVATYVGGGMVVSHGSQPGPFFLNVRYRTDVHSARRYIA